MHLIHNEKIKLKATWGNNVSVGLALGGFLLPWLKFSDWPSDAWSWSAPVSASVLSILVAWGLSMLFHFLARRHLNRLREE